MKFLVSCYRPATSAPSRRREEVEKEDEAAVHVSSSSSRQHRRAKRTNRSGAAAHGWRPSLQAIGEDEGGVSDLKGKSSSSTTTNERKPRPGIKSRDRHTSNSRRVGHGYDDEYDRYSRVNNSPLMMQPFSPAPFMF